MYPKFDCAIIVQLLCNYAGRGSITNKEYREINNIARTTATKDLNILLKKGIVTRVGKGKRELRYILTLHRKSSKGVQKDVQKDDENE